MATLIMVYLGAIILLALSHCYWISDTETLFEKLKKRGVTKYCNYLFLLLTFLLLLGMIKGYYNYLKGLNAGNKKIIAPIITNNISIEDRVAKLEYYQEIIRTQLFQLRPGE